MRKYKYYNRNPNNLHLKDCVCRAISTGTGLCYEAVHNLLEITASEFKCDKLCICCYHHLLEDILCYHRNNCDFKQDVGNVAEKYPYNTLIIRVNEHLTCSINGTVLDIWDCTDELVDCYWIIR